MVLIIHSVMILSMLITVGVAPLASAGTSMGGFTKFTSFGGTKPALGWFSDNTAIAEFCKK